MITMDKLTGRRIAAEALDGWAYLLGGLQILDHTGDFLCGPFGPQRSRRGRLGRWTVVRSSTCDQPRRRPDHHPRRHGLPSSRPPRPRGLVDRADAGARLECASVSASSLHSTPHSSRRSCRSGGTVLATTHMSGPGIGDELRDQSGALPAMWFQESGGRRAAATMASRCPDRSRTGPAADRRSAHRWRLACQQRGSAELLGARGPDGNKVCLCTWQERD